MNNNYAEKQTSLCFRWEGTQTDGRSKGKAITSYFVSEWYGITS